MKTLAAVLRQNGRPRPYAQSCPLSIEEVELDEPGPDEVLVEVRAAGLCHSDLSVIDGSRPRPVPMLLGHEAAGVVEAVGPHVTDLEPGDHVVMVFVPSCGGCGPCQSGRPQLCEPGAAANAVGTLLSGARRLRARGEPLHHHLGVSCFAQHAVVSRRSLVEIDREIPFERAALFGCAVLTGLGAVLNTARVPAGSTVAIVGLGGVGLNALLGARAVSARRIVAIDVRDDKLALARELGATDTFRALDPDCVEQARAATSGGVDFAFETAGSIHALEIAYRVTCRGGTTVSTGLPGPDHRFPLPHALLVAEERTVKGSYLGSCIPARDVPRFLALAARDQLPIDRLVSARVRLDEINAAFDRLASADVVRQVLVFDGSGP
jgi:alcohol dehydrogenase